MYLNNPSLSEAKQTIEDAIHSEKIIMIVGDCSIKYVGRAGSKLSNGERLIIIKQDGTFLVHQNQKMNPVNYQPPGCVFQLSLNENKEINQTQLELTSIRRKPKEKIELNFTNISSILIHRMHDNHSIKLFGSESQLSNLLLSDLHLIEKGLVPIKQEESMKKGSIDLMAIDSKDRLVVIEVKRRKAELNAVSQLLRYVDETRRLKNKEVRGILVAPEITSSAQTYLEREGLEFFKLDFSIGNPSAKINGLESKQKTLFD